MKCIVTGGAGFIGSHLCTALMKKGFIVYNIDNLNSFIYPTIFKVNNVLESCNKERGIYHVYELKHLVDSDIYTLLPKNILDLDILPEADMVIHLAGYGGVRPSIRNPKEYIDNNIKATTNLLELCRRQGIKKFVFASSSSIYGNNKKVPFSETDNVDHAISPYAATKKSMEVLSHVYHKIYDMDVIGLRFFTCYGARQRPDLAIRKFTKMISEGEEIPFFGDGETSRDYTYIDDIIDGVVKAVDYINTNDNVYEVFNLGEETPITLNDMVQTIEDELGIKAKLNRMPMQMGDVNCTYADISKAREVLGYSPMVNFKEGIRRFVEWFSDYNIH